MKQGLDRLLVASALAVTLWTASGCASPISPGQASPAASQPASPAATASVPAVVTPLQKEIQAQYDRMEEAWQRRDVKGVMAVCDESYMFTSNLAHQEPLDKKATEAATERFLRSMRKDVTLISVVRVKDAVQRGDQAVVHSETSRKMESLRRKPGQSRTLETIITSTDTWKRRPDGWKLAATHQEATEFLIDGKVQPPPPAPTSSPNPPSGAGSPAVPAAESPSPSL